MPQIEIVSLDIQILNRCRGFDVKASASCQEEGDHSCEENDRYEKQDKCPKCEAGFSRIMIHDVYL